MASYFNTSFSSIGDISPSISPIEETLTITSTKHSRSSSVQQLIAFDRIGIDVERQSTVSTTQTPPSLLRRLSRLCAGVCRPLHSRLQPKRLRLNDTVQDSYLLDAQLITLGFAMGIADVACLSTFGAFASLQTGNLVTSAVTLLTNANHSHAHTHTLNHHVSILANAQPWHSILAWLLASVTIGQLNNILGPRRKNWLVANNFLQALLVFTASALLATAPGQRVIILCLLAFAGGMQTQMARGINIGEITSAMVMAAMMDIVSIPKPWTKGAWVQRKQGRRIGALVMLFLGAVVGGCVVGFVGAWQALLGSAVVKLGVALSGFVNVGEEVLEEPVVVVVVEKKDDGGSFGD